MKDLSNQIFGSWKVIKLGVYEKDKHRKWLCECQKCHKKYLVSQDSLVCKRSTQCRACSTKASHTRYSNKKLRTILSGMKQRCYDKNHKSYNNYGGRGITVCNEWLNDGTSFEKWALKNGYQDGLTIDRIDYNKGYSPDNCRWITTAEQNRNKRNLHYITIKGITQTATEWARYFNKAPSTILFRLKRSSDPKEIFYDVDNPLLV